jgi:hypothetical protein
LKTALHPETLFRDQPSGHEQILAGTVSEAGLGPARIVLEILESEGVLVEARAPAARQPTWLRHSHRRRRF